MIQGVCCPCVHHGIGLKKASYKNKDFVFPIILCYQPVSCWCCLSVEFFSWLDNEFHEWSCHESYVPLIWDRVYGAALSLLDGFYGYLNDGIVLSFCTDFQTCWPDVLSQSIYVELFVSMLYIYVEACHFVNVGDCVEFIDDLVCALWNKNFFCEEGNLG